MVTTNGSQDRRRDRNRRETFVSGQDVVERIRGLLNHLGEVLDEASKHDSASRDQAVFDILERERARIAVESLADFERLTSPATTKRMHQYSATIPTAMLQPPESSSPHALAAWMSATIDRFGMIFDELASGCESERVAEPFRSLAASMRSHARRIARIATEALLEGAPPRGHDGRASESRGIER